MCQTHAQTTAHQNLPYKKLHSREPMGRKKKKKDKERRRKKNKKKEVEERRKEEEERKIYSRPGNHETIKL